MRIFDHTIRLTSVKIYNRKNCCGDRLQSVEVRAGIHPIEADYKGRITKNSLCGTYVGPGENAGVYTVTCNPPIHANIVTLQIVASGDQTLQLDEVTYADGISDRLYICYELIYLLNIYSELIVKI